MSNVAARDRGAGAIAAARGSCDALVNISPPGCGPATAWRAGLRWGREPPAGEPPGPARYRQAPEWFIVQARRGETGCAIPDTGRTGTAPMARARPAAAQATAGTAACNAPHAPDVTPTREATVSVRCRCSAAQRRARRAQCPATHLAAVTCFALPIWALSWRFAALRPAAGCGAGAWGRRRGDRSIARPVRMDAPMRAREGTGRALAGRRRGGWGFCIQKAAGEFC
jgi:hypothetical protein